jgi:hypothetical protein
MTDRELLELAAKAARYVARFKDEYGGDTSAGGFYPHGYDEHGDVVSWWNPLEDDGDALRLAVNLSINIALLQQSTTQLKETVTAIQVSFFDGATKRIINIGINEIEPQGCPYTATRRAIVRAAAEIGKGTK